MRKVIPFSGNLSQYGYGPEHIFWEFFQQNQQGEPAPPGTDPNPTANIDTPHQSEWDMGGKGIGGGMAELGHTDDPAQVGATLSGSTTDDIGELGLAALAATNPGLAAVAAMANIGLGKNAVPSEMGFKGFVDSAFGFDNPTDRSFSGFAEQSDLYGGITDQSFAGFAETSDQYGGADSGGLGGGMGGGMGGAGDQSGQGGIGDPGGTGGASGTGGFARGGRVKRYAGGGLMTGPGGGMDDMIPATIEGRQLARLSDGEFVIPADVVSALGDGSTNAGAKRLYALIKGIRTNKFGKDKQPDPMKRGLATLMESV
jgi:hypothetical protein